MKTSHIVAAVLVVAAFGGAITLNVVRLNGRAKNPDQELKAAADMCAMHISTPTLSGQSHFSDGYENCDKVLSAWSQLQDRELEAREKPDKELIDRVAKSLK